MGREVLAGILSPVRAFNRIISGEAWRHGSSKGRTYSSVPVNFIVTMGPRFLAEQEGSKRGTTSLNINFRIDYGNPFNDDFYSPYEWFRFNFGMDLFSAQPVVSQVNEPYGEKLFGRKGRVPFPPDYSNISTSITRSSATEAT